MFGVRMLMMRTRLIVLHSQPHCSLLKISSSWRLLETTSNTTPPREELYPTVVPFFGQISKHEVNKTKLFLPASFIAFSNFRCKFCEVFPASVSFPQELQIKTTFFILSKISLQLLYRKRILFNRREFPRTETELKAIAPPAITGFNMPNAASGIPNTL